MCVFGVWGAAWCGEVEFVFGVAFGGMMAPLVIKIVYLFSEFSGGILREIIA